MIMVFDYDDYINPSTGHFRYKDGSSVQTEANVTVFDQYEDTPDYTILEQNQLKKWKMYAGLGKGYFFLLSWTLTNLTDLLKKQDISLPFGIDIPFPVPNLEGLESIEELARKANSKLSEVLEDQIKGSGAEKPNIVYIDFVDSELCRTIISYNFQ